MNAKNESCQVFTDSVKQGSFEKVQKFALLISEINLKTDLSGKYNNRFTQYLLSEKHIRNLRVIA